MRDTHFATLTLSVLLAAPGLAAPPTPFTSEVESRFAEWDKNSDGVLQPRELDSLVVDNQITGNAAAALGALKAAQRSVKAPIPPVTIEYLHNYEQQTADHARTAPNFDRAFARALKRISSPKRDLLSSEEPSLDSCHQGPLGDCYFISVVGAAVARDADAVRKMISVADDGSFNVTFGDGRHAHVEQLTDTELALTSTTGSNGLWLPVLEKAYGSIRTESLPEDKQSESTTDAIAHGGSAGSTIRLLTGHEIDRFSFRPRARKIGSTAADVTEPGTSPDKSKPAEAKTTAGVIDAGMLATHLADVLPKVREQLIASIRDHRLVAAGTAKEGKLPPGVNPNHAYAILGYDATSDTVRLWNPHGNTFRPKGDPGLDHGYPTKAGQFDMPLDDLARTFAGISFETDKPLHSK